MKVIKQVIKYCLLYLAMHYVDTLLFIYVLVLFLHSHTKMCSACLNSTQIKFIKILKLGVFVTVQNLFLLKRKPIFFFSSKDFSVNSLNSVERILHFCQWKEGRKCFI